MKALLVLNDGPYGSERTFNALRVAMALGAMDGAEVRIFLLGDAVGCAKRGQTTPEGAYNIGRMVHGLQARGVVVGVCGSCLDARGFTDADLIEGTGRATLTELADWTVWADRVLTF
jgi:uncharacterized protein involved in oxidation of intracellular sulfur